MVLTGDVKEKTLPFNNPTSCNTIHALSPLPDDLVTELLKQIVNREVTCSRPTTRPNGQEAPPQGHQGFQELGPSYQAMAPT